MQTIVTATYSRGFDKAVITFFSDESCEVATMGSVSDQEVMQLCAAEAGLVSGWECELS